MNSLKLAAGILEAYQRICTRQHLAVSDDDANRWVLAAVALRFYLATQLET